MNKFSYKKVLIVAPYWDSTFHNKNIGKLINNLIKEKVEIIYYCQSSEGDKDFKNSFPNIKLLNFMKIVSLRGLGLFTVFKNTVKLIYISRPEIVFWTYAGYKENIFFNLFGIPTVIKMDSHLRKKPKSLIKKIIYIIFYEIPLKKSLLILSETEIVKKEVDTISGRNSYLFPNGVPVKKFKFIEKTFQSTYNKKPFILFTGRIMGEKGIDILLNAFERIHKDFKEWELKIVGPIIEKKYFKDQQEYLKQNGLTESVHFIPFQSGKSLYKLYHDAQFFVLPSRHEGLPNRLTEAMFFKNSVIAFNVNQVKVLVTDEFGEIIDPFDTKLFSEKLSLYMSNQSLRLIKGKKAREEVLLKYNDEILWPPLIEKIFKSHD